MVKPNFENTRLVIADGGGQIRDEIRSILRHEGFRDIVLLDNLGKVRDAIAENRVDLLITDHNLPGGDTDALIRQIRHHQIGNNPFIVIISMAKDPEKEEIMRIIDSGADDLLLKPLTAGMLVKRVNSLVTRRKDFVVTADYIGPTRRPKNRKEESNIPEIEVPNPVKRSALGQVTGASFQKEIDSFVKVVNEQKVERNAFQISFLVEKILPLYQTGKATTDTSQLLDRLKYVSEDIGRRLKGSKHDHVSELCSTLLGVVNSICRDYQQPSSKDLQLLQKLSLAIDTAFSSSDTDTDITRSISDTVQQRSS